MKRGMRLISDERGVLSIEALALFAIWILLWWVLLFQTGSREDKWRLTTQTRHCAWRMAVDACEEPLPEACQSSVTTVASETLGGAIASFLEVVDSLLSFITGEDVSLDRRYAVAFQVGMNPRPAILGGGEDHYQRRHVVPCNQKTRTRTLPDVMGGAYDQLFGW